MSEQVFRRTIRIPVTGEVDKLLVQHLQDIESERPYKLQEWLRAAVQAQFERDLQIIQKGAEQ